MKFLKIIALFALMFLVQMSFANIIFNVFYSSDQPKPNRVKYQLVTDQAHKVSSEIYKAANCPSAPFEFITDSVHQGVYHWILKVWDFNKANPNNRNATYFQFDVPFNNGQVTLAISNYKKGGYHLGVQLLPN